MKISNPALLTGWILARVDRNSIKKSRKVNFGNHVSAASETCKTFVSVALKAEF